MTQNNNKRSVLLLCPDVVSERMAGPAIRYWEFARALAGDYQVTLATPNEVSMERLPAPGVRLLQHHKENIAALCMQHELIIFQGYISEIYPEVLRSDKILIADLYDPIPLEGLEQHRDPQDAHALRLQTEQVALLNRQLRLADYFLCASERQRDLWLGALMSLGRINPFSYNDMLERVLIVPFGLPDEAPASDLPPGPLRQNAGNGMVLLWGGGIWEWFDPLTPIRAAHRLAPTMPDLQLVFLGTRHPNPAIPVMPMQAQAEQLARELDVYGKQVIFQEGWVPYEELPAYFLDADVGVSAHSNTLETRFSFRTRILHYLWAGKPVITTRGDVLADLILEYKAGVVVDYHDEQAWVDALLQLNDANFYANCQLGVRQLATHYTWTQVTQGLHQLCAGALPANDINHAPHGRSLRVVDPEAERETLRLRCEEQRRELDAVYTSKSWRLTAGVRGLRRYLRF